MEPRRWNWKLMQVIVVGEMWGNYVGALLEKNISMNRMGFFKTMKISLIKDF